MKRREEAIHLMVPEFIRIRKENRRLTEENEKLKALYLSAQKEIERLNKQYVGF